MQRDFTYIDDIVEGIVLVMNHIPKRNDSWKVSGAKVSESSAPYKIYNIGNSKPVQLIHFLESIENELGKKAQKELLPMQPGDVPCTFADVADLILDTGYKPSTGIEDGIKKFIEWYKGYYKVE
jgi:UDP-glucuronate 4-epimerase